MNVKALTAEFIGTFALIFVGVGAIASDFMTGGKSGLVGIALAHGLIIAVMVSATAAISGGHINPAVTIGFWITKKIDNANAIGYIIAQCLGGILGAYFICLAVPTYAIRATNVGIPELGGGVPIHLGFIMEIFLTFFLMFVILGTAVDKRAPKMGGLFIGLTVTLDILVGGPISGGCMNPARYLGPAVMGGGFHHLWLYWVAPTIGAILGAVVYTRVLEK